MALCQGTAFLVKRRLAARERRAPFVGPRLPAAAKRTRPEKALKNAGGPSCLGAPAFCVRCKKYEPRSCFAFMKEPFNCACRPALVQ